MASVGRGREEAMVTGVEDMLRCAVCLSKFTEPKVLPCYHTFCKGCLSNLLTQEPVRASYLNCPSCRAEAVLDHNGLDGLATDFKIKQIEDLLKAYHKPGDREPPRAEAGPQLCDICLAANVMSHAEKWCQKCATCLCFVCVEQHSSQADHQVVKLDAEQVALTCSHHKGKQDIKDFCWTCQSPVCSICVITRCQPHKVRPLRHAARDRLRDLNATREKIKNVVDKKLKLIECLENLETTRQANFSDVEGRVKTMADGLTKKVEDEQKDLMMTVRRVEHNFRTEVMAQKDKQQGGIHHLNQLQGLLNNMDRRNPGVTTLRRLGVVEQHIRAEKEACLMNIHDVRIRLVEAANTTTNRSAEDEKQIGSVTSHFNDIDEEDLIQKFTEVNLDSNNVNTAGISDDASASTSQPSQAAAVQGAPGGSRQQSGGESAMLVDDDPPPQPRIHKEWLLPEQAYQGWDVCMMPGGDVAVTTRCSGDRASQLYRFDNEGALQAQYSDERVAPRCIVYHSGLQALVTTDHKYQKATVLRTDGTGQTNSILFDHKLHLQEMRGPAGIDYLRNGHLVITENGNLPWHGVAVHDEVDGQIITNWGGKGREHMQLLWPHYVCVDEHDRIIVSDQGNRMIKVFSQDGEFIRCWDVGGMCFGVCAFSRHICVSVRCVHMDGGQDMLRIFSSDGRLVHSTPLANPAGVAYSYTSDQFIVVTDHKVARFARNIIA